VGGVESDHGVGRVERVGVGMTA